MCGFPQDPVNIDHFTPYVYTDGLKDKLSKNKAAKSNKFQDKEH